MIAFAHAAGRPLSSGVSGHPQRQKTRVCRWVTRQYEKIIRSLQDMLVHFASMVRRSATVTAAAAVVMVAICGAVAGYRGVLGALIGAAVVAFFFGLSILAVGIARAYGTQAIMLAGIVSYLVKMLVLIVLIAKFSGSTAFSGFSFGATVLALVAAYDGSLIRWWTRTKMLYVEPDGER